VDLPGRITKIVTDPQKMLVGVHAAAQGFRVDVFACPKCEGRMQRIAFTIRPKRSGGRIGPNQRR